MGLAAGFVLGSITIIAALVVLSKKRRVPLAALAARPPEGLNRQRVIASLARIVPPAQRVCFEATAFVDLPELMKAMLGLCGPDAARFVAAHAAVGELQSHSVTFEKYTFEVTVAPLVGLGTAGALLGIINRALNASHSARRVALLFDQQHHWFAVLEPGFAARLQRVGVLLDGAIPEP